MLTTRGPLGLTDEERHAADTAPTPWGRAPRWPVYLHNASPIDTRCEYRCSEHRDWKGYGSEAFGKHATAHGA